ncbi:MAG: hypothetical protein LIO94_08980, partial [Clostridiales bacterium]|nr:hypothetical protein [Clostridiales bacterium]
QHLYRRFNSGWHLAGNHSNVVPFFDAHGRARNILANARRGLRGRVGADEPPPTRSAFKRQLPVVFSLVLCYTAI